MLEKLFNKNNLHKADNFVKTSLLGGIAVILPVFLLCYFIYWIFQLITDAIQPITNFIVGWTGLPEIVADIFVVSLIITACFFTGIFVKTSLGGMMLSLFEKTLMKVPGYKIIKDIINQFIGGEKSMAFKEVVIAQPFSSKTKVTAFITSEWELKGEKIYTIFAPTAPNFTSGFVYHCEADQIIKTESTPDQAMKTVVSCGAGTKELFGDLKNICEENLKAIKENDPNAQPIQP